MSAIRYRPNNVCASVLGDIPGGTAYVKTNPKLRQPLTASPVKWLGFICSAGCRKLTSGRRGKLVATAITNGDGLVCDWRDLGDRDYVVGWLMHLNDHNFGAFALVDRDGWPLVRSEDSPRLTVINTPTVAKIRSISR